MNKIFLLIAAGVLLIMTWTSPAQIRHMMDTGAPLAIILWLSPIVLLFALYHYFRKYPAATFHEISMSGSKGGAAEENTDEENDFNIKNITPDLVQNDTNNNRVESDKFRE